MIYKLLFTLTFLCTLCIGIINPTMAEAYLSPVLITEVQTGAIGDDGQENPKHEFIELASLSSPGLDMTGWRLEYLSAANDGSGEPTALLMTFEGRISPNTHVFLNYVGYNPVPGEMSFGQGSNLPSGMLAKSGGHVRLIDNHGEQMDCVGWGSAVIITGCDKVVGIPVPGQTIQRPQTESKTYQKLLGVYKIGPPTPIEGRLWPTGAVPVEPEEEEEVPECRGVELSEVLPNPAGSDAENEFIELYNSSDKPVSLLGCGLQFGTAGKSYDFPASVIMEPYQYRAFGYATTGLQLTNSGGQVRLIAPDEETSLTYPASTDDQAWALIDGAWQTTFYPTPSAANALGTSGDAPSDTPSNDAAEVAAMVSSSLDPCPAGKFRNPETNRCKNIASAEADLKPCDPGQERNPQTNRCRTVTTTSSSLTPCKSGQERNPSTNRCRNVAASGSTLKPCEPGQERSPETNRCRKVAGAATSNNSPDNDLTKGSQNYRILIVVLVLIGGYAIYEYRRDIQSGLNRMRRAVSSKDSR